MIKVKEHPVTGEKYIQGSNMVIFESGILVLVREFVETTHMTKEEVEAKMQEWSEDPDKYRFDFKYAQTTGIIRRFQKKVQHLPPADYADKGWEDVENLQKSDFQPKKIRLSPASIILFVMSVVGIMSAVMSAYHTTIANQIFGRPTIIGLVTGTVMVLFSATAFTAARWFWAEKGIARMFSALFAALGIMVILYSMMSTLVVNYGAWSKTEEQEKTEITQDSEELSAFNARVQLKQEELDGYVATEKELGAEAEYWKDKSWKRYDALQEQLTDIRKKITEARSELSSLISERPQVASKIAEDKEDVFTFLSTFIKISPRTLRLFMQAVPAMFFDIIAPFALSCAIYLAEKRNKKEDENE